MKRLGLVLFYLAIYMATSCLQTVVYADEKGKTSDYGFIQFDDWPASAVSFLFEHGLCEDRSDLTVNVDESARLKSGEINACITVQAYFTAKIRVIKKEPVSGDSWLFIEALAAQYAVEIEKLGCDPINIIRQSEANLPEVVLPSTVKELLHNLPLDHWLLTWIYLFNPRIEGLACMGRSFSLSEVEYLYSKYVDDKKIFVEEGCVIDAGELVVLDSLLRLLDGLYYDHEIDTSEQRAWLRSQPEYPRDLLEGT